MNFIIEQITIKRFFDHDKRLIFEYPIDTLLDNVPSDMWPIIINYVDICLFGVTINWETIKRNDIKYRPITFAECLTGKFKKEFVACYLGNNGIMALSPLFSYHVLCCKVREPFVDEDNKTIMCSNCKEGDIIKFFISEKSSFRSVYHPNIHNIRVSNWIISNTVDIVWIYVPVHYRF